MLDVSSSSHEVTRERLYKRKSTLTTESTYVIPMTFSLLGAVAITYVDSIFGWIFLFIFFT